ncbi:MAG: hypothetical protein HHJ14_11475 [Cellulomonas sp.]|nr:hypothetical protein [Cellulomonas sp.]
MLATLAVVLFLSLLSSGYLLLVSAPRVSQETELAREANQVLVAMVNQETGLRGWLGTADPVFLEPYQSGKESAAAGSGLLLTMAGTDSQAASQIVDILVARAAWDSWAQDAAQRDQASSPVSPAALTQFLLDGKALFDVYRAADARAMQTFTQRRDHALTDQRTALFGGSSRSRV